MREILFKGKRVDNGEWVHGDLLHNHDDRVFVGEVIVNGYNGTACDRYEIETGLYEVLPETVGQYTGLTDKNGTKIFEGDIVVQPCCPSIKIEVLYSETYMVWFVAELDSDEISELSNFKDGDFEIIGNIHDNQEGAK